MEWKRIADEFPPIGKRILTFKYLAPGEPCIQTDELRTGHGPQQDPALYYWNSGDDFNEVTHWAEFPNLPDQE